MNKFEKNPISAILFFDERVRINYLSEDEILGFLSNNTMTISSSIANIFVKEHDDYKARFIYEDFITIKTSMDDLNYNPFHDAKLWEEDRIINSLNTLFIMNDGRICSPNIYGNIRFEVNCSIMYKDEDSIRLELKIDDFIRYSTADNFLEDRLYRTIYMNEKKMKELVL